MNAYEIAEMMIAAKTDIDAALIEWREAIDVDAEADDEMRRAMARAMVTNKDAAPKATVALLEALVDLETSDLQQKARHAEQLRRSAGAAFDAKVRWLMTLSSLAAMTREEARLANYEPRETAP